MSSARARLVYAVRASKVIAAHPREGFERVRERLAEQQDRRHGAAKHPQPSGGERELHELLGLPWPCPERREFGALWAAVLGTLAERRLVGGRGRFGGWDDGDARLCRLAWCLARHLRPERVLETGVGRGLTTRVLLEGLERNGAGHLWSVDLPPLLERRLAEETGAAVTPELRGRWTLIRGSSRHVLPRLLDELGHVDLFVHDSMHTTRNVTFELECVWPALAAGGVALVDDVERNRAFGRFIDARPNRGAIVCEAEDRQALLGAVVKPIPAAISR
jgi:predicted O-methyltransferase YrrM